LVFGLSFAKISSCLKRCGLIGRGEVDVLLTVDGKAANTVKVSVR
jgi:hypothetical protein